MSAYRSHRNTTNTDLFTKNEINGLVNTWNQSSTNEQIALSTFLVQQFPDNAHEIFQDIAPKSSVFSQIGYLTLNGLQNGADARYMEITTTHILQGMEIDKLKVQTYMMGTAKDKSVADSLGTSFNTFTCASNSAILLSA